MKSLLHRLKSAVQEWRDEKRDLRLWNVFLVSSSQRWEAMESVTSATKYLMLALLQFAQSELETTELRLEQKISSPMWGETRIPMSMRSRWDELLCIACRFGYEKFRGIGFEIATEKGPVSIFVTRPPMPAHVPDLDDMTNFIQESCDAMETFLLSKKQAV